MRQALTVERRSVSLALRQTGRAAGLLQQLVGLPALALELGQRPPVQLPPTRHADFHGIDEVPIDDYLVMEVRPGRQPRRAHVADHLALADPGAGLDAGGEAGLVVIGRHVAVRVLDLGAPAIAAV